MIYICMHVHACLVVKSLSSQTAHPGQGSISVDSSPAFCFSNLLNFSMRQDVLRSTQEASKTFLCRHATATND